MDTLKSLAVISLLGAVLYGVYVVASKPDKPLSPEIEAMATMEGPIIERGSHDEHDHAHNPHVSQGAGVRERGVARPSAPPAFNRDLESENLAASGRQELNEVARATFEPPADPLSHYEVPHSSDSDSVQGVKHEVPLDEVSPSAGDRLEEVNVGSNSSSTIDDAELAASQLRVRKYAFKQAWEAAQEQVAENHHREALAALSAFYNDSALSEAEREQLVGWLDALAAKVIYSTEHLLELPHEARRSETLYTIANRYSVPYLLLKNINGIRDPEVITPGTRLKVLRGPFHAEVDLSRQEITLFVQNYYAGRFPCALGKDAIKPGEYLVQDKNPIKEFRSAQETLAPNDPRNPYGGMYLDLGRGVAIHSSPAEAYLDPGFGSISVAPRDAEDLFSILSKDESKVIIR